MAATGFAATAGASAANAQDQWWDTMFGRAVRTSNSDAPKPPAKEVDLKDLRQSNIPWRSEEMVASIDKALVKLRDVVKDGDWRPIPDGRLVRVGEYDERIPMVRRRLYESGELSRDAASNYSGSIEYDSFLDSAVRRFQASHGLRETGFLNRSTLAQLNISPSERVSQLELNRGRIERLLAGRVADRYVLVNAAAYQLEAVERFEVERRHRVIVGKPDRQTPEIQAEVRGLNFFPYWRVPHSVAVKDLIPRLIKEPEYLEKEHIRLVEGHFDGPTIDPRSVDWTRADPERIKFRQDPGPWNALGLVRINMPNPDIVYMHDTPMKPLFKQAMRAFSAGCVRVEGVMELAQWLLRHEAGFDNPEPAVQRILDANQPVDIELSRPVPVHFTYITAWAERDGTLHFRPDIYGRDGSTKLRGERDPDEPPPPVTLSP